MASWTPYSSMSKKEQFAVDQYWFTRKAIRRDLHNARMKDKDNSFQRMRKDAAILDATMVKRGFVPHILTTWG